MAMIAFWGVTLLGFATTGAVVERASPAHAGMVSLPSISAEKNGENNVGLKFSVEILSHSDSAKDEAWEFTIFKGSAQDQSLSDTFHAPLEPHLQHATRDAVFELGAPAKVHKWLNSAFSSSSPLAFSYFAIGSERLLSSLNANADKKVERQPSVAPSTVTDRSAIVAEGSFRDVATTLLFLVDGDAAETTKAGVTPETMGRLRIEWMSIFSNKVDFSNEDFKKPSWSPSELVVTFSKIEQNTLPCDFGADGGDMSVNGGAESKSKIQEVAIRSRVIETPVSPISGEAQEKLLLLESPTLLSTSSTFGASFDQAVEYASAALSGSASETQGNAFVTGLQRTAEKWAERFEAWNNMALRTPKDELHNKLGKGQYVMVLIQSLRVPWQEVNNLPYTNSSVKLPRCDGAIRGGSVSGAKNIQVSLWLDITTTETDPTSRTHWLHGGLGLERTSVLKAEERLLRRKWEKSELEKLTEMEGSSARGLEIGEMLMSNREASIVNQFGNRTRRRLDTYSFGSYRALCASAPADWDNYPDGDFEPEGCDSGGWKYCSYYGPPGGTYWSDVEYADYYPYVYCCKREYVSINYFYDPPEKAVCPCPAGQYSNGGSDATGSCDSCPVGQFSNEGTGCEACPAGTYAASTGTAACSDCNAGTYSAASATSCDSCTAGQYSTGAASACTPCPAGAYSATTGSTTCTECDGGKYQGSLGETTCDDCDPGEVSSDGASSCSLCIPGFYSAGTGQASPCTSCQPGTYQASFGATDCIDCPAGTVSTSIAQSDCVDCVSGRYVADVGQTSCSACPAGKYEPNTGSNGCDDCSLGEYSPEAAESCTACPVGTFADTQGTSECDDCSTGKYQSSSGGSSCDDCASGTFTSVPGMSSCTDCQEGKYSENPGSSSCTSCSAGRYANTAGSDTCSLCDAGTYSGEEASICAVCDVGTYSSIGAGSCPSCLAGKFATNTGQASCDDCSAGTFAASTRSASCADCLAGTSSDSGAAACTDCEPGDFQSQDGAASCDSCPAGSFSENAAAVSCDMCAAGQFQPADGGSSCLDCDAGKSSSSGAVSCDNCDAGRYTASAGSSSCDPCLAGSFSDAGADDCTACFSGYAAATEASTNCDPCIKGYYSANSGATTCLPCEAGRYGAIIAASDCASCSAGKFSKAAATNCLSCLAGTFSVSSGMSYCENCTAGTYSLEDSSTCLACSTGFYNALERQGSCFACPEGKYSDTTGAIECLDCEGGSTSTAGSSSCDEGCPAGTVAAGTSCIPCPAGSSSEQGDTNCTLCGPGSFTSSVGTSSCMFCPGGRASGIAGSTNCTLCEAGQYSSLGATECTDCLPGYFSAAGASSCSDACPAGSYAENAGATGCTLCPGGTFSPTDGSSACIQCPVQSYCPDSGGCSQCIDCEDGKRSSAGKSICTDCPAGRVGNGEGLGCSSCNSGQYMPFAGTPSTIGCSDCTPGTYSNAGNVLECSQCLPGFYSNSSAVSCVACKGGKYSAIEAASCSNCRAGRYSFSGSSSCELCPIGTYSNAGSSSCEYCNNGTFGARTGASNCTKCEPGRYTLTSGAFTSCALCAKGMEAPTEGRTHCKFCAAGKFASSTGTASCSDCYAGYWCGEGSISPTENDCTNLTFTNPENFYCPAGTTRSTRQVADTNEYTLPEGEAHKFNREDVLRCPRTSNCEYGLRYAAFLWKEGTCAEAVSESSLDGTTTSTPVSVSVDEATPGAGIGGVQRVLSPYNVTFKVSPASLDADDGGPFTVKTSGKTVEVVVARPGGLDFETLSYYKVLLVAESNGTVLNCSLNVHVNDVNEPPTLLLGNPPMRNISEAAGANDYVNGAPAKADDEDVGDEHIFEIVAIDGEPYNEMDSMFNIGGCSGKVYLQKDGLNALEKSSYELLVRVIDDAGDPLADNGTLTINVTNSNDAPRFLVHGQHFDDPTDPGDVLCFVDEGSPANTSVGGANCSSIPWTDPDLPFGDGVTWSISRADADASFDIDANTGNITVASHNADGEPVVLDYETQKRYSIQITITDLEGLTDSLDILIQINNVNEPPTTSYPDIFVNENTPGGTEICPSFLVSTEDPDSESFTYSIQDTTVMCASCVYINADTGNDMNDGLTDSSAFKTIAAAQRKASSEIDGCVLRGTFNISASFTFKTGWSYTGFGSSTIIKGGSSSNAQYVTFLRLVYDLHGDNDPYIFFGKFVTLINVVVANHYSTDGYRELMYYTEAAENTLVMTQCLLYNVMFTQWMYPSSSDASLYAITKTVSANSSNFEMTDDAPSVHVNYNYAIAGCENTVCVDDDIGVYGGTWGWAYLTAASDRFEIDSSTGALSVASDATLDYEEKSVYRLTVRTNDNELPASQSSDTVVSITLLNVNEAPVLDAPVMFRVDEDADDGSNVGRVFASDPDGDQSHTFTLSPWHGKSVGEYDQSNFRITGSAGEGITVGELEVASGANLDFETHPQLFFVVTASDGSLEASHNITVNVTNRNDVPKCMSQMTVQVLENVVNVTIGESGSFNFTDEDDPSLAADLGQEAWGKATLSVGAVSSSVVADYIEGVCDEIDCTGPGNTAEKRKATFRMTSSAYFDFEATPEVTFVATVVDGGGLSCSTFVTVHVIDVNEAPFFDSENDGKIFYMSFNANSGTSIGFITADDPDSESDVNGYGTLVYAFAGGQDAEGSLEIIAETGEIKCKNSDGLSVDETRTAVVIATDGGNLNATTVITLRTTNERIEPLIDAPAVVTVAEDTASETDLAVITVTSDTEEEELTFSIVDCRARLDGNTSTGCGERGSMFSLVHTTASDNNATLKLLESQLDYEDSAVFGSSRPPRFDLTIEATVEYPGEPRSSFSTMQVIVTDVPESPTLSDISFLVNEDVTPGSLIGSIQSAADDPDDSDIADLKFSIVDNDYYEFPGTMTWTACAATCASMGREMVCAKNDDENAAIFAKFTEVSSECDDALQDDAGACSGDSGAWLGLKTLGSSNDGTWIWPGLSCADNSFTNWAGGQAAGEYFTDNFNVFDGTIWAAQCSGCTFANGELSVMGNEQFMRSEDLFLVRAIQASLVKDESCDDHLIVLAQDASLSWGWSSDSGSVKFVWNCANKYIYGQYASTYTYCSNYRTYNIHVSVSSDTVSFSDDYCGTLTLSDDIGASSTYIYLGADTDYGETAVWDWVTVMGDTVEGEDSSCAYLESDTGEWSTSVCGASPDADPKQCICQPGPFNVSESGSVFLKGTKLDYETLSYYTLPVTVTDPFNLSAAATVTISVNDVDEAPIIATGQTFFVSETAVRSSQVGTVLAYDDGGATLTYELLNYTDVFSISVSEGDILVGGDDVTAQLDYECQARYEMLVRVIDISGKSAIETITVLVEDVNDLSVTSIDIYRDEGIVIDDDDSNPGLLTLGGDIVVLTGTNFGPCGTQGRVGLVVTVTYSNGKDGAVYTAEACNVTGISNEEITCKSVPGVGAAHSWNITIDSTAVELLGEEVHGSYGAIWSYDTKVVGLSTNYRIPTIIAVDGADAMATLGGEYVTISGTDFPPGIDGTGLGGDALELTYRYYDPTWPNLADNGMGSELNMLAESCSMATDQINYATVPPTQVAVCVTAEGAGGGAEGLFWWVTLGANGIFEDTTTTRSSAESARFPGTSYASPEIEMVNVYEMDTYRWADRFHELDTEGTDWIFLTGKNFPMIDNLIVFGDSMSPSIKVTYGGDNGDKYESTLNYVVQEHEWLFFQSAPGVGKNLTFRVWNAGLEGRSYPLNSTSISYRPPVVRVGTVGLSSSSTGSYSAVYGAGVSEASTSGGQQIVISGVQFGPSDGEDAPIVTYGPRNSGGISDDDQNYNDDGSSFSAIEVRKYGKAAKYTALECTVSTAHSQISCLTAEGVGYGHWLRVSVGGQISAAYPANISYAAPNVNEYFPSWETDTQFGLGASTRGGQWIIISGRNFGTVAENAVDIVTYGDGGTEFTACGPLGDDVYVTGDILNTVTPTTTKASIYPVNQISNYFMVSDFTFPSSWTVEMWVKPYTVDADNKWWWSFATPSNYNCMVVSSLIFPTAYEWYYVVITYDGSLGVQTAYIDGLPVSGPAVDSYPFCGTVSGTWTIGVEQDTIGGDFDILQTMGMEHGTTAVYREAWVAGDVPSSNVCVDTSDPTLYAYWEGGGDGTDLIGSHDATVTPESITLGPDTTTVCSSSSNDEEVEAPGDIYYSCPDSSWVGPETCLILSGLIDGPLPGGKPKAVELYAACDIPDLSSYGLGLATNSGGSDGQEFTFPSGSTARVGTYIYIAFGSEFETWFGFPEDYRSSVANFNGNDALELFHHGTPVDVYGVVNASANDIDDASWNMQDGWAYRRNLTAPCGWNWQVQDAAAWDVRAGILSPSDANNFSSFATNYDAERFGSGLPVGTYVAMGSDGRGWNPLAECEEVVPCGCRVITDHVAINCTTVPGAGSDHSWIVTISGQASTAAKTKYAPPLLSKLSGPGVVNASTYGGEEVTISGSNFGPAGKVIQGNTSVTGTDDYNGESTSGTWQLVYELDMATNANWDTYSDVPYSTDNCDTLSANIFTKMAYEVELDDGLVVWVEFDAVTSEVCETGVPVDWSIDETITGLTVEIIGGNDDGTYDYLERHSEEGYIEFWSNCYSRDINSGRPGASSLSFDFDDTMTTGSTYVDCYGSMQIHHSSGTIFAYNGWSSTSAVATDVGIGTNTEINSHGDVNPDWTLMANGGNYATKALKVWILDPSTTPAPTAAPTVYLERVTYGPGGVEFEAEDCRVIEPGHSTIVCRTVPGTGGFPLFWVITVDGQTSEKTTAAASSYAAPKLYSVTPERLDTVGGSVHVVNGTNLGMSSSDAYLRIYLDGEPENTEGNTDTITTLYPRTSALFSSKVVTTIGDDGNILETVLEEFVFVMPRLSDEDHAKLLTVEVGYTATGAVPSRSNPLKVMYRPPLLKEVQNKVGDRSGTQATSELVLKGQNFGLTGTVYVNGQEVDSSTFLAGDSTWSDELITLKVLAIKGNVSVTVGEYNTETLRFDDFSPVLATNIPLYLPDPNGYRTDGRPDSRLDGLFGGDDDIYFGDDDQSANNLQRAVDEGGAGRRNVTVAGAYFGSDESVLEVTVGGEPCEVSPGSLTVLPDVQVIGTEVVRSLKCAVPDGFGSANEIVLSRSGKSSFSGNETSVYLKYESPVISSVYPTNVHTTGGGIVTISGHNFGPSKADISVRYTNDLTFASYTELHIVDDGSFSHTSIHIIAPEGDGEGEALSVVVGDQVDTVFPSAEAAALAGVDDIDDNDLVTGFKYYVPNVTSITGIDTKGLPTSGGKVIVRGSDLGTPGSLRAHVIRWISSNEVSRRNLLADDDDDAGMVYETMPFDVNVVNNTHDMAIIVIGAGQGVNELLVNVSGQVSFTPLAYAPPNITLVYPDYSALDEGQTVDDESGFVVLDDGMFSTDDNSTGRRRRLASSQFEDIAVAEAEQSFDLILYGPTSGGANLTLSGTNFGIGTDFLLSFTSAFYLGASPGYDGGDKCSFTWTESDIGGSIVEFSDDTVRFISPQGQCDGPMNLSLSVGGQESRLTTGAPRAAFIFAAPSITFLSNDGGISALGENCVPSSEQGCGLNTAGGYTVTIVGENFGVADRSIRFNGKDIDSGNFAFYDSNTEARHTMATFVVPPGVGKAIHVEVVVGDRASAPALFNYDPPYVTTITPNEFDAAGDVLEIYGRNFGNNVDDAGDITIRVENTTCGPVMIGAIRSSIWQQSVDGTPYLWCSLGRTTVGEKAFFLDIAGQNLTFSKGEAVLRGTCSSGYYGQAAWTVYTLPDSSCYESCSPVSQSELVEVGNNDENSEEAARCTGFYDSETGDFRLESRFVDSSGALAPTCKSDWPCLRNIDLAGDGPSANCTALTMQDEYCTECPQGSVCEDFTTLYSVEPYAVPGYWREQLREGDTSASGIIDFQCDPSRKHRSFCWNFGPCAPLEACEGDNTCSKGYTEERCAQCCDKKFGRLNDGSKNPNCWTDEGNQLLYYRLYGKCTKCPDDILWLLIGGLVALIVIAIVGYQMHKKKVDLAIFSIGVDYFQILAIFANTEVAWPESVRQVFKYMSLFNFNINVTPPECAFEVSYRVKWMVIEWFPTVMFGSVAIIYSGSFVYFRYCANQNTRRVREMRNNLIAGSLLIMYVLYLNISENTLDPMNCKRIENPDDGTKTEEQFMMSQPSEVCWQDRDSSGGQPLQQELFPYAVLFFIIYTIGYPALVASILLRPENQIKAYNDQLLRCMGTGSRKATNRAYYNFRSKFATLYFKFKPKFFWWILIIILRKLCIVTFTLVFHINATMQLSMILLVIFLSYTAQVKYSPYLSRADYAEILGDLDQEEYDGLVGPYGVCPQPKGIGYDVMLAEKEEAESRRYGNLGGAGAGSGNVYSPSTRLSFGMTVLKMRSMNAEQRRAALRQRGEDVMRFMFNYNTVESSLLFSAILVCLFGIMFASEFMEPGDALYEVLGELTLAVIGISCAYYFVVIWCEVVAVMFPSLACSFVSGDVKEKRDQQIIGSDGTIMTDVSGFGFRESTTAADLGMDEDTYKSITQGMSAAELEDFKLRQIDKDVVYEDTNPVMLRELERQMAEGQATKAIEIDEGRVSESPTLLSVEEQVQLQETVASLMNENKTLKMKVARSEATSNNRGGASGKLRGKQGKKLKHKRIGKEQHQADEEEHSGGEGETDQTSGESGDKWGGGEGLFFGNKKRLSKTTKGDTYEGEDALRVSVSEIYNNPLAGGGNGSKTIRKETSSAREKSRMARFVKQGSKGGGLELSALGKKRGKSKKKKGDGGDEDVNDTGLGEDFL